MYTRIVFVSRLSAIGDVIIAQQTLNLLTQNNYYPIFITSHQTKSISQSTPTICIDKEKNTQYHLNGLEVSKEIFLNSINIVAQEKKAIFLDLQKTSRSKRALNEIKNFYPFEKYYCVSKRTFYRFFLIVLAFLCFSQKKRSKKIDFTKILTIEELQKNVVKKIVLNDKKEFHELDSLPPHRTVENYICLFPGASGFIKMWPKENFRHLIKLILEKTEYEIVLCGSKLEKEIGEYLEYYGNSRVKNYIDKTNLQETLNLISKARYIVTNDSFPAHAAKKYGVPCTVLFGSTSPKFGFAPQAENIKIEYLNLSCSPCTRHGKSICRYKNLRCLKEISAQSVFENI